MFPEDTSNLLVHSAMSASEDDASILHIANRQASRINGDRNCASFRLHFVFTGLGIVIVIGWVGLALPRGSANYRDSSHANDTEGLSEVKAEVLTMASTTATEGINGERSHPSRIALACMLKRITFTLQEPMRRLRLPRLQQNDATSCAIVSSSGAMAGSRLGEAIDQHDVVWRFNFAPAHGFEKDVGARTDVRMFNDHGLAWLQQEKAQFSQDVYYFIDRMLGPHTLLNNSNAPLSTVRQEWTRAVQKLQQKIPRLRLAIIGHSSTAGFNDILANEFSVPDAIATTGAIGVLAAMHFCSSISLYNMARTKNAHHQPYHYWEANNLYLNYIAVNAFHRGFFAQDDLWKILATEASLRNFEVTGTLAIDGFSRLTCDEQQVS